MIANQIKTALLERNNDVIPEDFIPIVVPIAMFAMITAIVFATLYYRYRALGARQDLVRTYLERGQQVPKELIEVPVKPPIQRSDLRRGLVLLAGGVGISMALEIAHQSALVGIGIVPALIGLAYMASWRLERADMQSALDAKEERDRVNG